MCAESTDHQARLQRLVETVPPVAAGRQWDAIVIGAGCAGSVIARELARAGHAVLLVEKAAFPREKVCGCCLNAAALGSLAGIGLGALPASLGAVPIRSLSLSVGRTAAMLALPTGAAVSRGSLDNALVHAAVGAGVAFLPGTTAAVQKEDAPHSGASSVHLLRRLTPLGSDPSVPNSDALTASARCVIVADGLAGTSLSHYPGFATSRSRRSYFGASTILTVAADRYQAGIVYMHCGIGGYVGVVRLEDGRLNVAAAIDPRVAHQAGGIGAVAAHILTCGNADPLPALLTTHWHGTPALTRRRCTLQSGNIIVLGDAAGYIEPFTGEGMAWAFASAIGAAHAALALIRGDTAADPQSWPKLHRRMIVPRQRICRVVAWTLRRPLLTAAVVRLLTQQPKIALPVLRHMTSPFDTPTQRAVRTENCAARTRLTSTSSPSADPRSHSPPCDVPSTPTSPVLGTLEPTGAAR